MDLSKNYTFLRCEKKIELQCSVKPNLTTVIKELLQQSRKSSQLRHQCKIPKYMAQSVRFIKIIW